MVYKNNHKRMKYLKRFSINEKSDEKCDFDTFKDIMLELTDTYSGVVFSHKIIDYLTREGHYQCQFKLYKSAALNSKCFCEINKLGSVVGDVVGYRDDPENIEDSLADGVIFNTIDNYINSVEGFKDKIDNIIQNVSKIKEVFKDIEDYILPRFKHFSNFETCSVGLDPYDGTFIITFDNNHHV